MLHLRSFALVCCISIFSACKTFQVSESKTIANTPTLGVEWDFTGKLTPELKPMVDSVVNKAIADYNAKSTCLKLHLKQKKDKDFVSLDFVRTKKVNGGGKAAGYIVTTLGLVAVPAAMIAGEAGFFIVFWYWPEHEIISRGELSPNMSADKHSGGYVGSKTGALFARNSRQIPKLLNKYYHNLMLTFSNIEGQLVKNGQLQTITKP